MSEVKWTKEQLSDVIESVEIDKGKCVLAYIFSWLGGLIVLYGLKDNERNTKYHAAQAIVLGLGYMILAVIINFLPVPFLGTILGIVYLVAIVFGIIKVCNGDDPELPIIGQLAQSMFSKKIEEK